MKPGKKVKKVLVCWIGKTDINRVDSAYEDGSGPIRTLLNNECFDAVHFLDSGIDGVDRFLKKLRTQGISPQMHQADTNPIDYRGIYDIELEALKSIRRAHGEGAEITVHLSPGSPTMTACWILLSRRFKARLVQTIEPSFLKGTGDSVVKMVDLPGFWDLAGIGSALPREQSVILPCARLREVYIQAERVAKSLEPVLITGETGTGKELLARSIHRCSERPGKFVAVNCGAIVETLFESEFFGHKKGAFTGAAANKVGYLELAENGTLFLDEIGDLPLAMQVKLLRVLQDREYRPVGDEDIKIANVRVVSATHKDLLQAVQQGEFRKDLFYRIAILEFRLPALREYGDGLSLILDHFLDEVRREYNQPWELDGEAREALLTRSWLGNLREMRMIIRRLCLVSEGHRVTHEDVLAQQGVQESPSQDVSLQHALGDGFSLRALVEESTARLKRHYLEQALARAGNNLSMAARLLGEKDYHTIQTWMRGLGMPLPTKRVTKAIRGTPG